MYRAISRLLGSDPAMQTFAVEWLEQSAQFRDPGTHQTPPKPPKRNPPEKHNKIIKKPKENPKKSQENPGETGKTPKKR